MRVKEYTLVGFAADAAGIAASQASTINVPLTLTGAAANLSPPREVEFFSTLGVSTVTFTIVGRDRWGNTITEAVVGPGAGLTTRSTKIFAAVTSITPSATDADVATVGWVARTVSPWVICGKKLGFEGLPIAQVSLLIVAGAADGIAEVTYDSNQSPAHPSYPHIFSGSQKGEGLPIDETIAITPGTPVDAQGVFCRVVLTTGAGTTGRARIAQSGP